MEHAPRVESRLDVRRLRGLCVDPDCWCGATSTASARTVFADPSLCRSNHRHNTMRLGSRGLAGGHSCRLYWPQANYDLRDSDLLDHDWAQRFFMGLDFLRYLSLPR